MKKEKKSKLKRLLSGSEVLFLAVYWLSLSARLLVGRDGWLSLVSFTCQSAWQANHRAPCCGAETVCQPCSSCKWHHLRSGIHKTVHVTKNIHTHASSMWKFGLWSQHNIRTLRRATWLPVNLHTGSASLLALLPSTLHHKSPPFFWQRNNLRTSAQQSTHTHIHQNIWQTDS